MAQEEKKKRRFFKDFKAELKKVIWPTPKQIVNGTIAVITIVLIVGTIVFALDLVFDLFNNRGINRIKEGILDRYSTTEEIPELGEDLGLDDELDFLMDLEDHDVYNEEAE